MVYIVVPVYNVEKYLSRCVDSLLAQTYRNFRIVLIDDGSTDNSASICDSYADKHENIIIIHKVNGGLSNSRNVGIETCFSDSKNIDSDYITFVDSDDFIHEKFIEIMVDKCEKENCQIAQCSYEKGNQNFFSKKTINGREYVTDKRSALLGYDLKSQSWSKVYKLSLFDGNEKFRNGVHNEDEFITYRLIYKCKKIAFLDYKLYYYFQRDGSIMHSIATNLKNSLHRNDWLIAYMERILFFEEKDEPELVKKTYEKICTDIILRYVEQMRLNKIDRDNAVCNGEYIRTYNNFFKKIIDLKTISYRRKLMYISFYMWPMSAVYASKVLTLRK